MIASIHIADVGLAASLMLRPPKPADVPGLRDARVGLTARFHGGFLPRPAFGRVAMISMWDDDESLDRFMQGGSKTATRLVDGWSVRMEPLRAHGSWPGIPAETSAKRVVDDAVGGPVVVLTLGELRVSRSLPWMRASQRAQQQLEKAEGLVWGMGVSRPPYFVGTMSVWESAEATMAYAYGGGGHTDAIEAGRGLAFMTKEIFARFRPYATSGRLDGSLPIAEDWLASRT